MKKRRWLWIIIVVIAGLSFALLGNIMLATAAGRSAVDISETANGNLAEIKNPILALLPLPAGSDTLLSPEAPDIDQFGYVMVTDVLITSTFQSEWEELVGTSALTMTFPTSDDGKLIDDIGFTFPFYEGDYTQLYVNDNGLLTFVNKTQKPTSDPIPRDTLPNNYIAAFWDNLDVGRGNDGKIYYATKGSTPNRYLLVEWANVTRYGAAITETLTFQIKLTEKGDIFFYYKEMKNNGSLASAGIEDPDGVDGIQVAYRQPGFLASRRKVVFARPAPNAYRVKVTPTYRGKFVVGGSASFPIMIRNTSDTQPDSYSLSTTSHPGWDVAYLDPQTLQPLPATFNLAAGAVKSIYVSVKPAVAVVPGSYTAFALTVQSVNSIPTKASTWLQAAVPAAFAMAYYQSPDYKTQQDGRSFTELIWEKSRYGQPMQDPFSGRNLAFSRTPYKTYVYAWDHPNDPDESTSYREVRFLMLNRFGGIQGGLTDIDDHASPPEPIADTEPVVAVTPSGRIAFAWKRAPSGSGGTYIENVFLTIHNGDGSIFLTNPVQVTNSGAGERVDNITVASTANDRFVLVWVREPPVTEPKKELWYAVFDHSGDRISANKKIIGAAGFHYSYPDLTDLRNGKILLSYTQEDIVTGQLLIKYRVCSTDCENVVEHTLNNAHGRSSRAALFASGKLLLGWTNSALERISYAVLPNYDNPDPNLVPIDFSVPINRSQDYLNIMINPQDQAVLVWMDSVNSNYLFYALLDSNGNILTPAMSFMGESGGLSINTSDVGQGVALFDGAYRNYLSFTRK